MRRILLILVGIHLCGLDGVLPFQAPSHASLTQEQQNWMAQAERHEKSGWIYLHVEGQPRERGFQYGHLMAKEIAEALRVRRAIWKYQTATEWEWLVAKSAAMMTPRVDPEDLGVRPRI